MTITQILTSLAAVKPMDKRTAYRHIRELNIQPLGVRQRPQNYPDNTPALILSRLGFETALFPLRALNTGTAFKKRRSLVSANDLKAAKGKGAR